MLFVSILTSERIRDPELWAAIWRGFAPSTLILHHAYNLAGNKRVFVWEGGSAADLQFMDRFNHVGELETYPAFDRTTGWQQAFAGDVEGFRTTLAQQGASPERLEAHVELRALAHKSTNLRASLKVGRDWVKRREDDQSD